MLSSLIEFDEFLFGLINGQWHNSLFDSLMPYWRDKYTWIPLYIILLGYGIFSYRKKALFWALALVLTVGVADTISSKVIKPSVERLRPCNEPSLKSEVRLLVSCGSGYSFTSSHATNHFAVAAFLMFTVFQRKRGLKMLILFWAASIAYGQVYVGVHFPIDILVGGMIGFVIGLLLSQVFKRISKGHEAIA